MSIRYLSNVALAVIGGALLVTSQAFGTVVFGWIMLGGGVAALAVALATASRAERGTLQRGLDPVVGLIAAWTIVASQVFSATAVTWLGFASGAAFAAIAVVGLTAHERSTERVVHSFEVGTAGPAEHAGQELAGMR